MSFVVKSFQSERVGCRRGAVASISSHNVVWGAAEEEDEEEEDEDATCAAHQSTVSPDIS